MRKKLLFTFISVALATLFWYIVGEVFVLKDNKNTITKLQCVSYAPFSKDESPFDFNDGLVISEDRVREDLSLLSKYTNCIRTYSSVGLEMIPKIARENGMHILLGAWVSSDKIATKKELDTLIYLANENRDVVKAVIVGNEVLLRQDTTADTLAQYIKYVKNALVDTQVTYADVWEFWLKNPEIRGLTDFVTIHILPYWEDDPMNIAQAIKHVRDVRIEVQGILHDKNILIGECGWPSEGRMREDALPSKINQAIFIRSFVKLAEENEWKYNIIEAFDQPWKRVSEGAVGGFWGLFDKNRIDKNVFSGDVSNFSNYKNLLFASIVLILLFSLILKGEKIEAKKLFLFSFINTFFAILFILQMEQYSVTIRTFWEFLWAGFVALTHLALYYIFLKYILQRDNNAELNSSVLKLFSIISTLVLIQSLSLAFDGRYRNFEVYIFAISAISFIIIFKAHAREFTFHIYEKAIYLMILLSSITILVNETFLNIYADFWVLISLVFSYILYKGSKKVDIFKLKEFFIYAALFLLIFQALKLGFFTNKELAEQCSNSDSFICTLRAFFGEFIYLQRLGMMALFSAFVAFFIRKKVLLVLSLFLSVGAVVIFNLSLGVIAFVITTYLFLK